MDVLNRRYLRCGLAALLVAAALMGEAQENGVGAMTTSTEWRDDVANIEAVQLINEAYAHMPFSREFDGVEDTCPLRIEWRIGPNLPVAWKGGVAGLVGNEIALTGGLWMPERSNLAYAFNTSTETFRAIAAPPVCPQYTQGACDGTHVFIVGGRSAGRNVYRMMRDAAGAWAAEPMPSLPEAEGDGRWLAAVAVIPGRWLFLIGGHPTGTPSETRETPALPDYRLALDSPDAAWTPMAPYPGGPRALLMSAVVRNRLYVFGGSHPEPVMRQNQLELAKRFGLGAPYGGVPNYRDAYAYNPEADTWKSLRAAPFPVVAGDAVPLRDRYILLMASADVRTFRVGRTVDREDPFWTGYGDRILCYDVQKDAYSHVGVMPYGVATSPWITDGTRLYSFGGEPAHRYNENTENVLQIGTIHWHGADAAKAP
ncbi:MAG TPA: hypothetical protein PLO37_24280 [Candidatus Hydrogenedentes bacterium]|nr:hypothetical protein [Candidatus Hydrogenedentota bacterium]HPG69982.1 hypothetical protein [Candidatus Hydrogenedentota bacterium]